MATYCFGSKVWLHRGKEHPKRGQNYKNGRVGHLFTIHKHDPVTTAKAVVSFPRVPHEGDTCTVGPTCLHGAQLRKNDNERPGRQYGHDVSHEVRG